MTPRSTLLLGLIVTACAGPTAAQELDAPKPDASKKPTLWIVPHTHWEGAVFKTREGYLEMGLPHILEAMHLLRTQPDFRFTLDQVAYVRPFLERYPEQAADFARFVNEGRLELVLGMDVMPDVNMPGGETFVRQMQYGKRYYRERLCVDTTAAWLADTFGFHAQIPQLLKQAGYTSFWHSRGVPRPDHPSEYIWEGLDGSRIAAFWMPHSYGLFYHSPRELPGFQAFMKQRFDMLTPHARGSDRFGPAGVDVCPPEPHLAPMVAAYNRQPDAPLNLRLAVPSEFEAVAALRSDRPVFRGELNPIFQGTYSSRIELKRWMRLLERRLVLAEKLGVLAAWLGTPDDDADLWRAWELLMFNETHDLASGVMTDHVYEDTIRQYEIARDLAENLIRRRWQALAEQIDTRGPVGTIPVIVFNPLSWPRSDAVEVDVGPSNTPGVAVLDPEGQEVPAQLVSVRRNADGTLMAARVAFVARDVPAIGHAVYRIAPRAEGGAAEAQPRDGDVLENERYRVTVDRATGAVTSLRVLDGDREALSAPGNVVARQVDRGDLWELYRGLDGGSKIAMTNRQPVPEPGDSTLSNAFRGEPAPILVGPVYAEYRVTHPFDSGSFETAIRLTRGSRRLEFTTTLVNNEKHVRYQVLFPSTIRQGTNTQEIPFGASERPEGIEFPAQNWSDWGDDQQGLAVLNDGLPGNVVSDGTLMVSLLRAHTLGAYGFGGGYEPGMSSESGYQLGKPRTMHYAVVPRQGDWRAAGIVRDGWEFNDPPIAGKAPVYAGKLPPRWGLLDVSHPAVVVSALTRDREGRAVLRLYEATGRPARGVKVTLRPGIAAAEQVNLLDDPAGEARVEDGALALDLGPFEIRTIRLQLGPAPQARE